MSYFEPKVKVLSKDCPCDFLYIWGGPHATFVHGHIPDIRVYNGKTQLPLRLKQPLMRPNKNKRN
jgi:hypothetical protein